MRVPVYRSQGKLDVPGAPRLPVEAAGAVAESLGRMAGEVNQLASAEVVRQNNLRQVQELNESVIGATEELFNGMDEELNGVEFNTDPEGSASRYKARSEQIRESYLGRIKDQEVAAQFQQRFAAEAQSNAQKIQTYSRKKREDLAGASLDASMGKLTNLVDKAKDDTDVNLLLGKGLAAIDAMVASGGLDAKAGQNLREEFRKGIGEQKVKRDIMADPRGALAQLQGGGYGYLDAPTRTTLTDIAQRRADHADRVGAAEQARLEKEAREDRLNATYSGLKDVFRDDPEAAMDFLADPEKVPGMPAEDVQRLIGWFSGDVARRRGNEEYARKEIDRQNSDTWIKQIAQGEFPEAVDIEMSDASPGVKEHFLKLRQKDRGEIYKTDPEVHAGVLKGIYDGTVTSREQILPLVGNGLAPATASSLVRAVEAPQSKMTDRYKRIAIRDFENTFASDAKMLARTPEFIIALDQVVEQKKLTGADVIAEARKLMEPYQQEELKSFLGITWMGEETFYPFLQMDLFGDTIPGSASRPTPKAQPAVAKRIEQLRADGVSDEKIRGFLQEKGVDPAAYGL